MHLFPRDPARKRKWVATVRREDSWIPTKHSTICSLHFDPNYFNVAQKQETLLKNAVPTLYQLYLPVYSQEVQSSALECSREQLQTPTDFPLNQQEPAAISNKENIQPDTPTKRLLRNKVQEQRKKIKRLQYHNNRRLKKKVEQLQEILDSLSEKSFITEEDKIVLEKNGDKTKDLLKRMVLKKEIGTVPRTQYPPELRTFALTLHFYSARAYKYVRKTFDTCLPAPRTLTKWYSSIDGKPGFTDEALKAIKRKVE